MIVMEMSSTRAQESPQAADTLTTAGSGLGPTVAEPALSPVLTARSTPQLAAELRELTDPRRAALLTDVHVLELHGSALMPALAQAGFDVHVFAIPRGQAMSDFFGQVNYVSGWLKRRSLDERDLVLTLGGGAISQLGAWVASRLSDGIPYVNLPTTLMAQISAACGGPRKVHAAIAPGVFRARRPPLGVIANVAFNAPLDDRRLLSGLAEYIKVAAISPPPCIAFLDGHIDALLAKDLDALEQLILQTKAAIDIDPERAHWFGQTVGSAIRSVLSCSAILHGDALTLGMVVEARIAEQRELVSADWLDQLTARMDRIGLPARLDRTLHGIDGRRDGRLASGELTAEAVIQTLGFEQPSDYIRAQLPLRIGESIDVDDVSVAELRTALERTGLPSIGALAS